MAKFTAIEWQSFSLKKDIEVIVKKLHDSRVTQISLLTELFIVILGAALTKIFADIDKQLYFWVTLLIFGATPLLVHVLIWIKRKYEENKPGSDRMNARTFVDAFDNEIAYCVLISESYYRMLVEALSYNDTNANKISINIIHFYYIQTSYYFQKAIADLTPLYNIADNVLSVDADNLITKKLISLPRYKNMKNLLVTIFEYLDAHKNIMGTLDGDKLIVELNEKYRKNLDRIDRAISLK